MPRFSNLPARIYADTSVFGGCFDHGFEEPSRRFFELVHEGSVVLLLSETVQDELVGAPPHVRALLASLPADGVQSVLLTDELLSLRDAYLEAGIVGRSSREDATHVAIATVAGADAIVSWNFRHIVSLNRIRGYNEVIPASGVRHLDDTDSGGSASR